jgi:hypothetical protein
MEESEKEKKEEVLPNTMAIQLADGTESSGPKVKTEIIPPTHDARGRFAKGNKMNGAGRYYAHEMAKYKNALYHALTTKDVEAVVKASIKSAKTPKGFMDRALLLKYACGEPPKTIDITTSSPLKIAILNVNELCDELCEDGDGED